VRYRTPPDPALDKVAHLGHIERGGPCAVCASLSESAYWGLFKLAQQRLTGCAHAPLRATSDSPGSDRSNRPALLKPQNLFAQ